ncbi:SlyX family protein [Sansalvadorimonas verongulae]|uniref:SlyX family protein n=1 Tax=Sansalvadorimonas verongulae TaxID=2172824 RepID=UPI0012BB7D84|nr:SlyX family protein [Sansalvadorimonas verongulae]MTI13542.1 SlyX family protein [Sansalvadorimonas verongulae]
MNDDLLELQTQLSYQDDSVQQLNEVVTRQQGELDNLRREVELLKQQLQLLIASQSEAAEDEVPPPHY